jgi:hypothetical protein
MLCNDPFVTYLKSFGYNVIRLPRVDIKPLQVLSRQGKNLGRLGDLADVMNPGGHIKLPTISKDNQAANISGQRTSDMSIGIGLNLLSTIIGAIGGSTLGLNVKYKNAKTASFEFNDVLEDHIKITQLDKFLGDADINPFSKHVSNMLDADEIYIISSTIKSKKFSVEAKKEDGTGLEVSIPEIQQLVGANVTVSGNAVATTKVTYSAAEPLIFGFQAVRLFYENGVYTSIKPLVSDIGMKGFENVPEDDGRERFINEGTLGQLTDL